MQTSNNSYIIVMQSIDILIMLIENLEMSEQLIKHAPFGFHNELISQNARTRLQLNNKLYEFKQELQEACDDAKN